MVKKEILDKGWLAARSTDVDLDGVQLTTTHRPSCEGPWMEAVVPGTVLATLVHNKLVPDPFYGLGNEAIVDIADSGREYYTFWFFNTFQCMLSENQHVDLNFRGINYSAEIFLNGHKIVLPKGMFRRHSLEITKILHPMGDNLLAVLVHPPDHPGRIPPEGGQGGDKQIGKDVATQYVEGWDWMIPIRDRNTGIWDEVSVSVSGPVKIVDPHLVSSFFDNFESAYLHTTTELVNKSTAVAKCSLTIQVMKVLEGNICLAERLPTQHVSLPPETSVHYTFPQLLFNKPNLWWPNGMGEQPLYDVEITVDVDGSGESDLWKHQFGFRKIESYIDSGTGGRLFKVNGEPIFIRGGNWILSEALLRLSKERYKTDIKFHAEMNLNMLRCWGGGLAERPEFYQYCDIYGLLVWQEFWITGDCDGRGGPGSNPDGPLDHELFLLCARDTVKLLRNHPSLALWVGGNEQRPPEDINTALKEELKLHPHFENLTGNGGSETKISPVLKDPSQYLDGTRIYVQGSFWDGFGDGEGDFAVNPDGPYVIQYPETYFKDEFYPFGFNPEVGSYVGVPVAATIRATMPPEGWKIPIFRELANGFVEEVANPIWVYHKYKPYGICDGNPKFGLVHDQILSYGTPKDLDDFCLKAQLVNYVQYKSLLEGYSSHMWRKYTGVLIWKTQNPWTGLRGQLYDHLLDQTAGFYGCRSAAEPIHVQLNLDTYFVEVVNTTSKELSCIAVEIGVWDLEGAFPYYDVAQNLVIPSKRTVPIMKFLYPKATARKPVYFLHLNLYHYRDSYYRLISRNFSWLHEPGGDYKLLESYKKKKVPLKITSQPFIRGSTYEIRMNVENTSEKEDSKNTLYKNNFSLRNSNDSLESEVFDFIKSKNDEKQEHGLIQTISKIATEFNQPSITKINGTEEGVAFFLHFSVHASKQDHKEGEDTRILPVHYSDNYFSLVPGEVRPITLSFELPQGVSPRVTLNGWNYESAHTVHLA